MLSRATFRGGGFGSAMARYEIANFFHHDHEFSLFVILAIKKLWVGFQDDLYKYGRP